MSLVSLTPFGRRESVGAEICGTELDDRRNLMTLPILKPSRTPHDEEGDDA